MPDAAALLDGPAAAPRAQSVAEAIHDRMDQLRPAERRVARVLLADYPSAGLRTAASLAGDAGVSTPSVVRFARSLGQENFTALQGALRDELRLVPPHPARSRPAPPGGSQSAELVHAARSLAASAVDSLARIPAAEIDAAVTLLADSSRQLFLTGGRFSSVLAQHLALALEQVRPRVRLVGDPFGHDMIRVVDLTARDVYLLVDFHRYQASTVELARLARKKGATVILITDDRLSPAAADADVVLPVSVTAAAPFHSLSAGIMLVELLVVPVVERLGRKGAERLAKWDEFHARDVLPAFAQPE